MFITILLIVLFVIFPAFVLRLCAINKFAAKFGPVLLCYAVGIIIGQTGIIEGREHVCNLIASIMIPIALPMLLFEINIRAWKKMAKSAFISMIISIVALIVMIFIGYGLFKHDIPESWKIGGLLAGLYTGGTPNLASIQTAIHLDNTMYIGVHTIDIIIGAVYMFFLISIGQKVFSWILPPYQNKEKLNEPKLLDEKRLTLDKWFRQLNWLNVAKSFGIALIITAIGGGLGLLVKDAAYQMAIIILAITTLAIIASNIPFVKSIKGSYDVGMYLILIFSIAVASMANFSTISTLSFELLGYLSLVMFGTMFLQLFICRLFKIDTDTMMVTSVALICSPPFVPVVCGAINNRAVMLSGITVGIVGYAVGNYLGITLAYILQHL